MFPFSGGSFLSLTFLEDQSHLCSAFGTATLLRGPFLVKGGGRQFTLLELTAG